MKFLLIAVLTSLTTLASFSQVPVVKTENGLISGIIKGDVLIFKGVPFAAPPVGDLRWKAPQPVTNWSGIRACENFSASPMQGKPVPFMMWTEEFISPPEPLSEDCLYLNIWSKGKSKSDKLPVFVWIYGGGFVSGSAACAVYDGEELAKQGIVFVSINYRVGPFGFLAHPELTKESGTKSSGNYAFLDQLAALRWVQNNIAAFGGDPGNVTIAGQSAGSFSINALVASPLGKGLFHRAIAQSGGLLRSSIGRRLPQAENSGIAFAQKAQAHSLAELRKLSAEEIQKVAALIPRDAFSPVLEDYVLPTNLLAHFQQGKHNDVPLLTGWVTGDASLRGNSNMPAEKFKQQATEKYGARADEFLTLFPAADNDEAKSSQLKLSLCEFAALPSYLWASNNKSNSYLYQYSFVPTDKPDFPNYGAFHTSEVPYALHTLHQWKRPWQARDYEMEKNMSAYWINFIRSGNPNGAGLPEWKRHTQNEPVVLELGEKITSGTALWEELSFLASLKK